MVSNRIQAHEKLEGYLLVALALGDERGYLFFPLGDLRKGPLWSGQPGWPEVAFDALGYCTTLASRKPMPPPTTAAGRADRIKAQIDSSRFALMCRTANQHRGDGKSPSGELALEIYDIDKPMGCTFREVAFYLEKLLYRANPRTGGRHRPNCASHLEAGLVVDGVDNPPETLTLCRACSAARGLETVLFEQDMPSPSCPTGMG